MLPLHQTLHLLADIARIRGRQSDAAEFLQLAGRLAPGPAHATPDHDSVVVRDALASIREHGQEAAIGFALEDVPQDLRRVVDAGGLTVHEAARVVEETGAISSGDLADTVARGALGWLDDARRARLREIAARAKDARPTTPLGRACSMLEPLAATIREACPEVQDVSPVGRARRFDALVGGLGLLVATTDPARTAGRLLGLALGAEPLHAGPQAVVFRLERTDVVIRLVTPDAWAHGLLWFTGSVSHLSRLKRLADGRGLSLGRDGLRAGGRPVLAAGEADLYAALGLPCIAPELREHGDEIDAALAGTLPDLVRGDQVRGDLHMHSDWSDGRNSIDAMVAAAVALGYEYVAITDHSVSSGIARGLDVDRLARQRDAVAAVREAHPGITVLHGAEVDILPDGSLDFSDAVLERLDVVLASLHDPADQPGSRLTERYVQAMRHPLVQVITHPTNRLVPSRAGYDLDERRLFETAVETRTLLEIDGAPGHLDMDGGMARRAIAAGVEVTIDGDCHRAEWLGRQMAFGVATARRGWVEARHVANTRSLPDLRARLALKRTAR